MPCTFSEYTILQIKIHLVLVFIQLAFSTVNIYGKLALSDIEPIPLCTIRYWFSVPISLIIALIFQREELLRSFQLVTILRVGIGIGSTNAIAIVLYMYGLKFSNPVNTATLYLVSVPLTAVLGMVLKYEKVMILKGIGVLLALGGALIMLNLDEISFSHTTLLGDLLIIGMVLFYTTYLVFTKKLANGLPTYTTSFWMFLGAGITCLLPLPFMVFLKLTPVTSTDTISTSGWISIFIVCFIGTTITYMLNNWALENSSPLVVVAYTPLELVSTVVLVVIVLKLELVWEQGVGSLLIVSGLVCVVYAKYVEKREEETDEIEIEEKGLVEERG